MPVSPSDAYPDADPSGFDDVTVDGSRSMRLEMRRQVREEQNRRFRSFLRRASFGSLVPGLGMILGGRRLAGWTLMLAFFAAAGTLVAVVLTTPRDDLVALAVNPRVLLAASAVLAVVAVSLLVSSAASHHLLQPAGIRRGQRAVAAAVVMVLTSLVVAPVALASRYAWVQHDLVSTVFATAPTTPEPNADDERKVPPASDPWEGVGRVNLLLMGSDAGPGREGTRPDTNVVASIDTETGDAVLFSLPRNMMNVPFPDDSPLSSYYPYGWPEDPNDRGSGYLNAIYRYVPATHPELFEGDADPGASAMMLAAEGITGLPISYYVLVDLDGFQQVVDALGGIDINVQQRIPIGSSMLPNGVCSSAEYYLEPGLQRLSGYDALWYARVRCGGPGLSDDYDRMRRQRCVIGAMIEKADPVTLLRRYESLAATAQQIVHTDIPSDKVAAFATLGMRVKGASVRSLPFTDVIIDPADPDYALIQAEVQAALVPPPPAPVPSEDGGASVTPGPADGTSPGSTPEPTPAEESGPVDLTSVC